MRRIWKWADVSGSGKCGDAALFNVVRAQVIFEASWYVRQKDRLNSGVRWP